MKHYPPECKAKAVVKHLAVLDAAGLGMRFDSEARW
jgi:hypothetical protein